MIFTILIALLGLVATDKTAASPITGKKLVAMCSADERSPNYFSDNENCLNFIYQVANIVDVDRIKSGMRQCVPSDVKPARLKRLIVSNLKFDKNVANIVPITAVSIALIVEFGCSSERSRTPSRLNH